MCLNTMHFNCVFEVMGGGSLPMWEHQILLGRTMFGNASSSPKEDQNGRISQ